MTTIARFEILPTQHGNTSARIANALQVLDQYPVTYETTATDTIIEADTVEDVFAAAQAAHQAIPDERVVTSLQVDELRGREQHMGDRVASVQQQLGRPPRKVRHSATSQQEQPGTVGSQQTRPRQVTSQQRQPQQAVGQHGHPQQAAGQHGQQRSSVSARPTRQNQSPGR